jgi:hypothetical protein
VAEYKVRLYRDWQLYAELVDFLFLSFGRKVNWSGSFVLRLAGNHRVAGQMVDGDMVVVLRKDGTAGNWRREFVGIYQDLDQQDAEPGTFTASGIDDQAVLGWRIVAWKASTTNRSLFTARPAETIATTLVTTNLGAGALATSGRELDGVLPDLTVAADEGQGAVMTLGCAWQNLLEALSDVAAVGGGDFSLAANEDLDGWAFDWHPGQLGADRRAEVVFAIGRGNMGRPRYRLQRMAEKTAAIVGGTGERAERQIVVRYGAGHSAARHRELFVDAADIDSQAGWQGRGDQALYRARAVEEFGFDVLQTPGLRYGRDYFLGDLVTAVNPFTGAAIDQQITALNVVVASQPERIELIEVETRNV